MDELTSTSAVALARAIRNREVSSAEVVEAHPGMVVAKTGLGATRVVDTQVGEQLPRIC